VYALLPFALMLLQGCWNWIRKNVLGQDDSKIPENVRGNTTATARSVLVACLLLVHESALRAA
jgi:hypothetical protein